ncbi:MAG: lipid-binding SYLF domain-containing protein [Proteobacteria bacterium]|nr:lipid-binding SYLF domain-containing protein [Pseudomonadota bacterium]MBU4295632.1 lipid-binding SYLF domain-containing protein [Pseudomonadota bacterium]MCG2746823.1 lipid-binding SYLF domain-containing protein [Desulfobulbaceae bacterium]
MSFNRIAVTVLVLFFAFIPESYAQHTSAEVRKVKEATEVMREIFSIPETAIPPTLLANAHAVVVLPKLVKAGFIIGGRYGTGLMMVRDIRGDWHYPVMVSLTGGSVGFQIGAQSTDIILVFKSLKSVEAIQKGKFTLGADASVAAGPVGRHAEADTDIKLESEIYSYSRSRGLFAGVALEGGALQIDHDATWAFYSMSAYDILNRTEFSKLPAEVQEFYKVLVAYIRSSN